MSSAPGKDFAVRKLRVLAGRRSRCGLLVVLLLCLSTAACSGELAIGNSSTTSVGPVTRLTVSATSVGDDWLSLSWTNPTSTYTGVMVRRLEGATAPTTTSGTLVSDFLDQADYVVDPGLAPGTQYSYAFFAYDGARNFAAAAKVTGWTSGTRRASPTPGKAPQ
jgi:hypothetical protein